MKLCGQCKTEKQESEFNRNKSKKDGLNTMCRNCSQKNSRDYYNNNTDYHKKYIVQQNTRRKRINRELVNNIKSNSKCFLCPENDPCCLDYHHLKDKYREISKLVGTGFAVSTIMKEIEKCILLCANCHRKVHAGKIDLACPTD